MWDFFFFFFSNFSLTYHFSFFLTLLGDGLIKTEILSQRAVKSKTTNQPKLLNAQSLSLTRSGSGCSPCSSCRASSWCVTAKPWWHCCWCLPTNLRWLNCCLHVCWAVARQNLKPHSYGVMPCLWINSHKTSIQFSVKHCRNWCTLVSVAIKSCRGRYRVLVCVIIPVNSIKTGCYSE